MAYGRSQSDIATVRDQLSLDYAEAEYLNVVTANLGIVRPVFGFSDAVWRAAVKAIALQYKQVRSAFEAVLEVILGPEYIQTAILAEGVEAGDTTLELLDASRLPQCGTITLDAGLASEEELEYVFIDYATNLVYLADDAANDHDADAENTDDLEPITFLTADVAAGILSIPVFDSTQFPTVYPYTILVGQGTEAEESLVVTNNAANILTLQNASTKAHRAPRPSVIFTTITQTYGADAYFLTCDDTTQFPESGFLLINGTTRVEYTSNDTENGIFNLKTRLTTLFAIGVRVELYDVVEMVEMAQVQVHGCGWHLYQTTPRKVELYLPDHCQDIGDLFSASYLHPEASSAASTTLAALASSGATFIDVVSSAAFPHRGSLTIEPGSTQSRVTYYKHAVTANRLVLGNPLPGAHVLGVTVELYQPVHTGTLLSGDIFNVEDVWAGPYVYDPGSDSGSYLRTTLAENLAGPTRVMLGIEDTTVTAIEVEDASHFPTTFPHNVRVGIGSGNREDVSVTAITFRQVAATTVNGAGSIVGATSLPCTGATITSFPNKKGYRIRIARGTVAEEIAYVVSRSGTAFTVESPMTKAHAAGETVELVNDVLSVASVGDFHQGYFLYSQRSVTNPSFGTVHQERLAETVHPIYSEFDVVLGTGFETEAGQLVLNYATALPSARARLASAVAAGGGTLTLTSSDAFPGAAHVPYYVVLGAGTYNQEVVRITANNTGTEQLTVDATRLCKYAHAAGDWVEFVAPETEFVEFDSRSGNTFRFSPSIVLNSNHIVGEAVSAAQESAPDSTGTDFPLRMPPDVVTRLRFLFDLVRAAGVEVVFITTR